jgi:hypothetical protein
MFETYRMLGEQREAELLREAQRLQAGASVRSNARRHRTRLDSFRARARRATRQVEWLPGLIRLPFSGLLQSRGRRASTADDLRLPVDGLSAAATEVETDAASALRPAN